MKNLQVKRTLLIVVEGDHDYRFLMHLKKLYLNTDSTHLKVVIGHGGSASTLVERTIRESWNKSFDKKITFLDADFADLQNVKNRAKEHDITIIASVPCCLECLLLGVVDQRLKKIKNCADCKSKLKKHLNRKDESCLTLQEFERHFPKNVIENKRHSIEVLDRLIIALMNG
jgi:hypothetical protein